MSIWYNPKREDIDIDGDDIDIYLFSDSQGAHYATVKKEDILEVLKEKSTR